MPEPDPESHPAETHVYDFARRRRGVRKGRERGCWVYIPATVLREADIDPKSDQPPFYRMWGYRRGSVLIRLYREG